MKWEEGRMLREFSTFGIGGPIRYFAEIRTAEAMEQAFHVCRKEDIPFFILGKGSNCLFDDAGFDGAVLLNRIDDCHWQDATVQVGAGFSFSLLGTQSAKRGFGGLEFAAGIPATVGGAIWMNAGAHAQETSTSLTSVLFLHSNGERRTFTKEDLQFSYRTSPFQAIQGAILSATFCLSTTSFSPARPIQLQLLERRKATQPLHEKSGGCIFRNPATGPSAGALIEAAGLKGASVGGAAVSELHANFIINRSCATSQEVKELIAVVQQRVFERMEVQLQLEIRVV